MVGAGYAISALFSDLMRLSKVGECGDSFEVQGDVAACVHGMDAFHVSWRICSDVRLELYAL